MQCARTAVDRDGGEEHLALVYWRADQLARLGLSRLVALSFAETGDWREVAALVDRGCPPEVALRIAR
jgi:hypothetical protein